MAGIGRIGGFGGMDSMAQTVLIIDDDRDINEMLGRLAQMAGWEYLKAETGADGLRLARREHPDVVILDMMLPDVDGYAICRDLTCNRSTSDIPVIMLSCMCQPSDALEAAFCGACRYLAKPFSPDAVLTNMREAVNSNRSATPPLLSGHFELAATESVKSLSAISRMIRDIALLTPLHDEELEALQKAFIHLAKWFIPKDNPATTVARTPLSVDYQIRLPSPGQAATAEADCGIHWTFGQPPADLLANVAIAERPRGRFLRLPTRRRREKRPNESAAYRHWMTFMELGGFTLVEHRKGAGSVHLVKRFRPTSLMVPADGTVLPVSSIATTQLKG